MRRFAFFVGAFALTGIPPLACFWSKMYVLAGALQVTGAFGPIVLTLVLIESLVSFGWFLWIGQKVFFGRGRMGVIKPEKEGKAVGDTRVLVGSALDPPASMNWVLMIMVILTLVVPLAGIPLVSRLIGVP